MPMTEDEMWTEIENLRAAYRRRKPDVGAELDEFTLSVIAGVFDGITAHGRWVELRSGASEGSRIFRVMERGPHGPKLVGEWEGASVLTGIAGLLEGPSAPPTGPLH